MLHHGGRDKVVQVMDGMYFHPKMTATFVEVMRECSVCQYYKGKAVT